MSKWEIHIDTLVTKKRKKKKKMNQLRAVDRDAPPPPPPPLIKQSPFITDAWIQLQLTSAGIDNLSVDHFWYWYMYW